MSYCAAWDFYGLDLMFLYLVQFIWTRGSIPYLFLTLNTCLIFVYFLNKLF